MSEIVKAEYAVATATFLKALQRLKGSMIQPEPNHDRLRQHRSQLIFSMNAVETFRPTAKSEVKDPLGYAEIIPHLGEATNVIMDVDDILPPTETKPAEQVTNKPIASTLPKLKIPTFDGKDVSKFPKFIHAAESILNQYDIPPEQKLLHLENALWGEPARLIESLPTDQNTFQTALEKLKQKYNLSLIHISEPTRPY